MKRTIASLLLIPVVLLLVFCSEDSTGSSETPTEDAPAVFELFTDDVTVYVDGDNVVLETTNIPNHGSPYFATNSSNYEAYNGTNANYRQNPNQIAEQDIVIRIPLTPSPASNNQDTQLGPIGISVNGIVIYNQFAGPNQPLTNEIDSFDQYNGHPQQSGQYHYHIEPLYLTANNGPESLIGFLLDGYPVYGPEENGALVSNADLDQFHGHSHATPEYPDGVYHYHITSGDPYINGGQYYGTPGSVSQ